MRRFLLDSGSRRLDFRHPAARVSLAVLALGAVAALAAASWIAYVDSRIVAATVTDPRDLYVENARRRIQAATDAAASACHREAETGWGCEPRKIDGRSGGRA